MTHQRSAVEQTTAARIVLATMELLPTGVAEGLWRHTTACRIAAVGACSQGRRMLDRHLLPALAQHPDWLPGWDAAQALGLAAAVRRLPKLLRTIKD